jgi:hypothetical protein
MIRKRIAIVPLAALPVQAYAHGEEVLVTIYAELLTIVFVIVAFRLVPRLRRFWLGGVIACILGVVASCLATAGMPYRENMILITAISVALPLLTTTAYIWRSSHVPR